MLDYRNILKSKAGLPLSNYYESLWGKQLGGWTVSGVLPLTFTARGGNAVDWVIYGNDDNGTEQLVDKSMFTDGTSLTSDGEIVVTPYRTTIKDYIPVNDSIYMYWQTSIFDTGCIICGYDDTQSFISRKFVGNNSAVDMSEYDFIRITLYTNVSRYALKISDFSLYSVTKGSTAPDHFIPYQKGVGEQRQDGYYVPLTISQQGQTDKTYDIYIGDSPLTEGETVSKTSTGVDVELFEGENVVDTTLYNKPTMKVKYK